jgi:D-arabinose 1-dehydrogenase-like Zn-dependent alcohol dehydrogenase
MQPGTILGHEGVGVVGSNTRRLNVGDRVDVGSTRSLYHSSTRHPITFLYIVMYEA